MIIRHDRSDRESLVDAHQWPGITSFFRGHGGASLIAPTWLLTAAHVAESIPNEVRLSVELAEKRYPIARTIFHPNYDRKWIQGNEDDGNNTVDLALVELEVPVENVSPFDLYEEQDEQGQEVLLLGQGEFGNGMRGARGSDRALRQATNQIDEADAWWLKFRFDAPPEGTFLEGVCGRGDSGGPAFIKRNHRFLIAGVSSWQQIGNRSLGTYGCVEHYTRISCFIAWIRSICGPLS
jgi:Trypsin